MKKRILSFLASFFFFLVWHVSSWLCSIPAWLCLILYFVIDLPIGWFWASLAAWLLAGLLRYALIRFGRWGSEQEQTAPPKENKNPYSRKNHDVFQ